ncbi:copia protein [Tanacetum coccineum]
MTTLVEHNIVVGAENCPPMLEKSMYDSWASRIRLFIKGKKHDECDVQATNIILHGIVPDVYALFNHQRADKDIWDRVKMLMKGTELSYQECECKLYNLFDKFAHVQGETLYEYYWRFSQLINDMHTIRMIMQQVQVNTKFLNALLSEWSKFVTDVKLVQSLYTTNYDQLYAYLSQHEGHANEVRMTRERYPDPLAFVANSLTLYNPSQSPQHSGEDPIECINKAMAFLSAIAARFPPSNNQLRTSSNPKNQATIQDVTVTVQQVQGRQTQTYTGTGNRGIATTSKGNYAASQLRVVKCYNCQGEGHMARQSKAQEAGQILDEEQLAFLANPDCDDLSLAKAVLMANLSSCDPEVLSEVPCSNSYSNDMINQDVQEMQYSEQTHVDDFQDNEIHSDSNIIPYSQYLQESQDVVIQDTNPSAPNDLLVPSLVE